MGGLVAGAAILPRPIAMLGAVCVAGLQMLTEVRRAGSNYPDPNSTMDDLSDLASVATRTRAQTSALSIQLLDGSITATGNSYVLDDNPTSPVSDISDSSYFSDLGTGSTVDVGELQQDLLVRRTIVLSDGQID